MRGVLVKAALVVAIGFGGYFLSSRIGSASDVSVQQIVPEIFMDCWSMKKTHTGNACTVEAYNSR